MYVGIINTRESRSLDDLPTVN